MGSAASFVHAAAEALTILARRPLKLELTLETGLSGKQHNGYVGVAD